MSLSKIEILDFQAEHLFGMDIDVEANARRAVDTERNMKAGGYAKSLFVDGRCVGLGGAMRIHPKFYHLWAHVTPELAAQPFLLHRVVKRWFREWSKDCAWERLEVVCQSALEKNCRWIESFGLKPVGIEEKAGPNGETMTRFARVR